MKFKVGDWVMTPAGARQIDGITPGGQIKVDGDRYKPYTYDIKMGDAPRYYRVGDSFVSDRFYLEHATEAEIAARKLEIEAQLEREAIQKARAKQAREFLRSFDWDSVDDRVVLYFAEDRGFKG